MQHGDTLSGLGMYMINFIDMSTNRQICYDMHYRTFTKAFETGTEIRELMGNPLAWRTRDLVFEPYTRIPRMNGVLVHYTEYWHL